MNNSEYDGNDFAKLDKQRNLLIDAVFTEDATPLMKKVSKAYVKRMAPGFLEELDALISRYFNAADPKVVEIVESAVNELGKI